MLYVMVVATVIMAALAAAMANTKIRTWLLGGGPLVGGNPLANNAIMVFVGICLASLIDVGQMVVSGRMLDSFAPSSNLKVSIDDMVFSMPTIPGIYAERFLSEKKEEVQELLKPFRDRHDFVQLTDTEARNLNEISNVSRQVATRPASTRRYQMAEVADLFEPAFSFYYAYTQWAEDVESWKQYLQDGMNDNQRSVSLVRSFIETKMQMESAAKIFMAVITSWDDIEGDVITSSSCIQGSDEEIDVGLSVSRGMIEIDFGKYGMTIPGNIGRMRDSAEKLVGVIKRGCVNHLVSIFGRMNGVFDRGHEKMKEYLDMWNEILEKKKPNSFTAVVTIANVGKFDTYIRRDVHVAVAGGGEKIIPFDMTSDDVDGARSTSPYLPVRSRAANSFRFVATFDEKEEEVRNLLSSAFNSGWNYVQIGVVANSGEREEVILSGSTLFSAEGKEEKRKPIEFDF